MGQFGQANACMRFHQVTPRLVRWLLNAHDRIGGDQILVTHEELAGILGVRRVGVTGAASGLQRSNLIRYTRGRLTIRDRAGLEAMACSCYATDQARYKRVMRFPIDR
jgi:CRP-like cAMP-binding protein